MQKILLSSLLLSCIWGYSQTELSFEYDEAGNQIYRGIREKGEENRSQNDLISHTNPVMSEEELAFWNEIKIGPNPVKDRLTIQFLGNIKENIQKISLYGQSSLGRELYTKDIFLVKGDREEIDMTAYLFGNYTISFRLKNGKVYSKHILKH